MPVKTRKSKEPESLTLPVPVVDESRTHQAVQEALQLKAIQTAEQYELAGQLRKSLKVLAKEVEEAFKPILDHARKMKAKYLKPLQEAQERLDGVIQVYLDEQARRAALEAEKKRQELLKKAEKLEKKGQESYAEGLRDLAETIQDKDLMKPATKTESLSFREVLDWEIVNPHALPEEYTLRVPNTEKIKLAVKEKGLGAEIPGVRVFLRRIPVSR